MNQTHLYILLAVIKNNGDIRQLKNEGLDYLEIADLTNQLILKEYVEYIEDEIKLTEKGIEKFEELKVSLKKTNKNNWIKKDLKSKIPKLEKNFIFLPNQNELDF